MSKGTQKSPSEASASSPSYSPSMSSQDEEENLCESDYEIIKFSEAINLSRTEKCKNKKFKTFLTDLYPN